MVFSEDEAQIVLCRLTIMPKSIKLNIGSHGSFTRDELINAIQSHTDVGELVVQMQMAYLRSFKDRVIR